VPEGEKLQFHHEESDSSIHDQAVICVKVAKSVIEQSDCGGKYTLDEVNIETDENLLSRYKNDIPVIHD
jgi:hypothetical protein